jgi:hypothetical protein
MKPVIFSVFKWGFLIIPDFKLSHQWWGSGALGCIHDYNEKEKKKKLRNHRNMTSHHIIGASPVS